MGYDSSTDIGEELKGGKKLKIEELTPKELIRKERLLKREPVENQNFKSAIGKIRLKKYGGNNLFNKAENFIEKWHMPLLLLICLVIGFFVLSQPTYLKGIEKSVKENILTNLEKQINLKVDLDYPRVSKIERQRIAKENFNEAKSDPSIKKEINQQIRLIQDYYKDSSGQTYVYGVDSYLFLTEAKNLIGYGLTSDKAYPWDIGPTLVNSLREAPKGVTPTNSFLSYLEYYTYKFTKLIGWSLEKTAFWLPLVFGLLSITLVFFIGKKIINPLGGFFSAFIFSVHQRFFTLNYTGFADTNYLNMFFSLLIMLLFIHFIDFKLKKCILMVLLAIPTTLLFRWTWNGYFYIFIVIFGFAILYLMIYLFKNFKIKMNKWLLGILGLLTILIGLYLRTTSFFNIVKVRLLPYTVPSGFFKTGMENIVELKSVPLKILFQAMGGWLFWIFFIIAFGYLLLRIFKNSDCKYYLFLIAWFIPTFIAGAFSSRFLFYAAPSFSILSGLGITLIFPLLFALFDSTHLEMRERTLRGIIFLVLILLILFFVKNDVLRLTSYKPPMNDAIYETAEFIRLNSDEKAVIDTWWDLGYMYQYYAKRGTIFDPGAFGGPRQYLISKAFVNKNETLAKFILQTQNCGGDWKLLDKEDIQKYSNLIDCSNKGFVVVSEDMLGKIYEMKASIIDRDIVQLAYFVKNNPKEKALEEIIEILNLTREKAEAKYKELLNFKDTVEPVKVSRISKCFENNNVILCDNGYKIINNDVTYKNQHPAKLYSYLTDKRLIVDYKDSKADFAFILYKAKDEIYSFMIETDLAETMIIRMFAGDKIDGFEEVYSIEYPVQIRTYKINN